MKGGAERASRAGFLEGYWGLTDFTVRGGQGEACLICSREIRGDSELPSPSEPGSEPGPVHGFSDGMLLTLRSGVGLKNVSPLNDS